MTSKRTPLYGYPISLLGLAILLSPSSALSWDVLYDYDSRHRLTEATYDNGLSVSYEYDDLGNRMVKKSNVVNLPPDIPIYLSPANGAVNIDAFNASLAWSVTDPNYGETFKYDLYLGTSSNPPLLESNIVETDVIVDDLGDNTTYYWKIVARDLGGLFSTGPVWSFTASIIDSDNDGLSDRDEINTYHTNPNLADTDDDGIDDGDERDYWGDDWNSDYDGDNLNNLLDSDSDNDGFSDGVEREAGTNPRDPNSNPSEKMKKIFMILDD